MDEPFPIHGNNDLPQDIDHREVKSHHDTTVLTGSESEELPEEVTQLENEITNLGQPAPAASPSVLAYAPTNERESTIETRTRSSASLSDQTLGGTLARESTHPAPEEGAVNSQTRSHARKNIRINHVDLDVVYESIYWL